MRLREWESVRAREKERKWERTCNETTNLTILQTLRTQFVDLWSTAECVTNGNVCVYVTMLHLISTHTCMKIEQERIDDDFWEILGNKFRIVLKELNRFNGFAFMPAMIPWNCYWRMRPIFSQYYTQFQCFFTSTPDNEEWFLFPFFHHIRLKNFTEFYSPQTTISVQFTYKTNKCNRHSNTINLLMRFKYTFCYTIQENFRFFQWNMIYNFQDTFSTTIAFAQKKNSAVKSNETAKIWRWRACQLIPPYCYCYICSDNSVRMTDVKLPSDYWIFEILPVWQFFWNYFTFRMW